MARAHQKALAYVHRASPESLATCSVSIKSRRYARYVYLLQNYCKLEALGQCKPLPRAGDVMTS